MLLAGCRRNVEIALQKCKSQPMEFLVLGPVEVRIEGRGVPLDEGRRVAAVSEGARDRGVRLVALAAGDGVLVAERLRDLGGGGDPDHSHEQPDEHDEPLMGERETRQGCHRRCSFLDSLI